MFVESLLLLGGAVLTTVVGTPIAIALAKPHAFRRVFADSDGHISHGGASRAAFEPMQLDPLPMRWPSEIPRNDTRMPERPWPSELWDDPHFGKFSKERAAQAAERNAEIEQRADARRANTAAKSAANQSHQAPAPSRVRPQRPAPAQRPAPVQRPTPAQRPMPSPKPRSRGAAPSLPDKAQLEAMVRQVGLAGTVQAIMDNTGWDFRKAAHYLAKTRRG